ncbi:YheC/YheD family protein [Paenibacillus sp. 481]|uniref:YheC/YheD family protein n=1 Tax=Paenibacillus sp. 481 TaxID=2835869 RepID=UPI001E2D3498|nr:YheC/YheD family protein [Paenibacillus sp. 481]UHA73689.1 YheC/YheD family protein [Paenibacillus sp. 481]
MKAKISYQARSRRKGVSSKWKKTLVLVRNSHVRRYVPYTLRYSDSSLSKLVNHYRIVYVKPERGSHGRGVMRVEKRPSKRNKRSPYWAHTGKKIHSRLTWNALRRALRPRTSKESYLVQQGINMLRYHGRLFDFRVVTQLDRNQEWQLTGMLARVAQPSKAVTNGSQGADIKTVKAVLLSHGRNVRDFKQATAKLRECCLLSARQLHKSYPFLRELGFDIALDKKLHPWILEVNTNPEVIPFAKLSDKTMFHRIMRYRRLEK